MRSVDRTPDRQCDIVESRLRGDRVGIGAHQLRPQCLAMRGIEAAAGEQDQAGQSGADDQCPLSLIAPLNDRS
jgi:hypothetical protein